MHRLKQANKRPTYGRRWIYCKQWQTDLNRKMSW
jgi:hypothetical protein